MISWRGFSNDQPGPLSIASDVAGAPFTLLPIGSTEQHGSVLPMGMDWIVATEMAFEVGKRLGAYVLPTIPMGTSMEHRGSSGTVWLRPATLAAVVNDIADTLAVWGMTRLAVLSGHGGNFILGPTVRLLNTEHPDRTVILVSESVQYGSSIGLDDLHVGKTEMSIGCYLLGVDPPDPNADFVPEATREELNNSPLLELSPTGVWGRPSQADPELGQREFEARVDRVTKYLEGAFGPAPARGAPS